MKRRASVIGMAVAALAAGAGVAFAMGLLILPMDEVTVDQVWYGELGVNSTMDITLAGVGEGYDVSDGTYPGWCLEDNFLDDPPPGSQLRLLDSTDDPANFPPPCENFGDIPWNRVNYLLNVELPDATAWDVQLALWVVAGTDAGRPLTTVAQTLVDLANGPSGEDFEPRFGDVIAVAVCADGIDVGTPYGQYQDTLFEVVFDGEGCTPGYWKQPQHLDSWVATGYAPTDSFNTVFEDVFAAGNPTLLQAAKKKGGGENALLRHATAALLNAAHPDIMYFFTVPEVIDIVQGAYADEDYEGAKDLLAAANERYCTLD